MSIRIASSYARALVGEEPVKAGKLVDNFETFVASAAKGAELTKVLEAPVIAVSKRAAVAKEIAATMGLDERVQKVVERVVMNKRVGMMGEILEEARRLVDEANGVTRVFAEYCKVSDSERQAFEKAVGIANAVWQWRENNDLVGGVRVRVADRVWDGSIRAQLQSLRAHLTTD